MDACARTDLAWDEPLELERFTRWLHDHAGGRRAESLLVIEGMDCAACSVAIEEALNRLPGVEAADVNPATGRARVCWDPARTSASRLAHAVEAAGYRAFPAPSLAADSDERRAHRLALWRLFVAGFCMMQVMMYATPAYVAAPGEMSPDIARLLQWAAWLLTIPVVLFSAAPLLQGAWRDLVRRRIGMDVPVALGILVTFVASTGATFDPGGLYGHEVYFDSLTMFVFFLLCGRMLEMRARRQTLGALEGLVRRVPETVERLREGEASERVSVRTLLAGDTVRIRPGEAFAADGVLHDGATQVDEALLTGESRPVLKGPGDAVMAGSVNLLSPVVVRIESVGSTTRYARIVALMEQAAAQRPALARAADRFAVPFLWFVLLAAAVAAAAWWTIDPGRSVQVAVSVLIVTCPCALSLATPSALLAAAGTLAGKGILVQRLEALEALADAGHFVFDKTGTLTQDSLELASVELHGRWTREEALHHSKALAQASLHPVSKALCAQVGEAPSAPLERVRELPGQGLEATDSTGHAWRLGSHDFACPGHRSEPCERLTSWLSRDGRPVATFTFDESVKPDAHDAIEGLHADGLRTSLLSGDRSGSVRRLAATLGIPDYSAHALPEDKLRLVATAQRKGERVAMVGDGMNDGPVLARADVSLAMGQGAALACAQADFTVLSGRPTDVVLARRLAVRTMRVVRQNLAWAAIYNAVCIPLALAGWLPPWLAGIGMASSSLLVVLNAQRLRKTAPLHLEPPAGQRPAREPCEGPG